MAISILKEDFTVLSPNSFLDIRAQTLHENELRQKGTAKCSNPTTPNSAVHENRHFRELKICSTCRRVWDGRSRCNWRSCGQCRKREYVKKMNKYSPLLMEEPSNRVYFMTFSLKNSRSLRKDREKAFTSFAKLRRQKLIVDAWDGGLAGFETKRTEKNYWNSHLHAIICGNQVDEELLCDRWEKLTGARVINYEKALNPFRALSYTLKSFRLDAECGDAVAEYNWALKGEILAQSFGSWYGVKEPVNRLNGCRQCAP